MPDQADTDLLVDAALAAGEIALKHFRTDVATYEKGDGLGPVTAADLEINEMLDDMLRSARPDYGWLSEESPDNTARLDAERVFIIDPIDGTRSFIAGEQGFSVAIAVAERGEVTSGVVHLPARAETFAATKGLGVTKNGFAVQTSAANNPDGSTVLTARKQMATEHWPGGVPPLERHFRSSLAWRMCLVAEGRFDSMLTFRQAYEWDIAAGTVILQEAGALVTDGHGADMSFNSAPGMQQGVVAAPESLHTAIMAHRRPASSRS